jgi:SAM-dependent methyltransferase
VAKKMAELAQLKPGQVAYDLGCGSGTILFAAAKAEPRAKLIGYEVIRPLVWWGRFRNLRLQTNIKFYCANFFKSDLSEADVIFCYLFPGLMERFYREIYPTLRPGTRIISHGFLLSNLEPVKEVCVGKARLWMYEK